MIEHILEKPLERLYRRNNLIYYWTLQIVFGMIGVGFDFIFGIAFLAASGIAPVEEVVDCGMQALLTELVILITFLFVSGEIRVCRIGCAFSEMYLFNYYEGETGKISLVLSIIFGVCRIGIFLYILFVFIHTIIITASSSCDTKSSLYWTIGLFITLTILIIVELFLIVSTILILRVTLKFSSQSKKKRKGKRNKEFIQRKRKINGGKKMNGNGRGDDVEEEIKPLLKEIEDGKCKDWEEDDGDGDNIIQERGSLEDDQSFLSHHLHGSDLHSSTSSESEGNQIEQEERQQVQQQDENM